MNGAMLVYAKEAREIIGVKKTRFFELTKMSGFPRSTRGITKRPMYLRVEIEEWVRSLVK